MLDTNIVIYVIKRKPIEVLKIFNLHAGQMCISSITLAELFHGTEKAPKEHTIWAILKTLCHA
jgi:tRNA(fMet)-specific endonuclease VapC